MTIASSRSDPERPLLDSPSSDRFEMQGGSEAEGAQQDDAEGKEMTNDKVVDELTSFGIPCIICATLPPLGAPQKVSNDPTTQAWWCDTVQKMFARMPTDVLIERLNNVGSTDLLTFLKCCTTEHQRGVLLKVMESKNIKVSCKGVSETWDSQLQFQKETAEKETAEKASSSNKE